MDTPDSSQFKPTESFEYYTDAVYWNDFAAIQAHHNRLISGHAHVGWREHVRSRHGTANRGLIVQCGNGWVERDFFRDGLISSVIGTDVSADLLNQARNEAQAMAMPAEYHLLDTNTTDFAKFDFDWVVNHAAFHHIAFIDRAVRSMARGMKPGGLLIGYDYTGPHRNQYPWEAWSRMVELNAMLPSEFRADLRYPHMPTILATDPTEAIHSELILDVVGRYFEFVELTALGGGLAYQLLYGNRALRAAQDTPEGQAALSTIIAADVAFTAGDPGRSFFTYWVAKPRKDAFGDNDQLDRWTQEEDERESTALANGFRYGPPAALEIINNQLADLRDALRDTRAELGRSAA